VKNAIIIHVTASFFIAPSNFFKVNDAESLILKNAVHHRDTEITETNNLISGLLRTLSSHRVARDTAIGSTNWLNDKMTTTPIEGMIGCSYKIGKEAILKLI
jgi:hypothetical protein